MNSRYHRLLIYDVKRTNEIDGMGSFNFLALNQNIVATIIFLNLKKKNKIENPYFLFPPLLIFLLIMHRKNKNNKNSTWYLNKPINFSIPAGGQHIKTDIFEITIFFCCFTIL